MGPGPGAGTKLGMIPGGGYETGGDWRKSRRLNKS